MSRNDKIRTVFYPQAGVRTFIDRMIAVEGFKSETAALEHLISLGMTRHLQILTEQSIDRIGLGGGADEQPVRE